MLLNARNLMTYFLSESLKVENSQGYWFSDAASDEALAQRLRHIDGAVLSVLENEKIGVQGIEDWIWIIAEYSHRELGIPARLDIWHHLAQAARTEPSLHVLRRYYRDHFFHAVEVCLLGHVLLDTVWSDGEPLWRKVGERLRPEADKEKVLRLWYITALFHDIGYGIELVKGARQLLKFFHNAPPLKQLTDDLKRSLDALSKKLAADGFDGLTKDDAGGEDHGMIGARHLDGFLKKIAEDDKTLQVTEYKPAVEAIARHNLRRKQKISFQAEPLAFLLILCDTLQEWDRPRLPYTTAPLHLMSMMQGGEGGWEGMNGPLDEFGLNIKPSSGRQERFRLDRKEPLHIVLKFNANINCNDSLFYAWLDATCNLQRLDMTDLDGDIEIEYISPTVQLKHTDQRLRQFQRLQDASRETRMNFLDHWFPNRQEGQFITNDAVTYWVESQDDLEWERLKLNLSELTKQELVTASIDDFEQHLVRWEHYNDNREFLSGYGLPDCPY